MHHARVQKNSPSARPQRRSIEGTIRVAGVRCWNRQGAQGISISPIRLQARIDCQGRRHEISIWKCTIHAIKPCLAGDIESAQPGRSL